MLNTDIIAGLNTAFNEATLLGVELAPDRRMVALTIAGVCMNADGSIPEDRRVQVLLKPAGKLIASLRNSHWDDDKAEAVPVLPEKLLEVVQSFGGSPIYGWNFFDCSDEKFSRWKDRISLNYESGGDGMSHTLDLFQGGVHRILDIRIWFDEIKLFTPTYGEISIEEFIKAGKRGWDAIMLQNNKKAQDAFTIYPASGNKPEQKS